MSVVALSRELPPADKGSEVRLQGNISQRKKKKCEKFTIQEVKGEKHSVPFTRRARFVGFDFLPVDLAIL
ncbi:hypothetical protein QG37_01413 [Candidozyma auris]|nr:hypothetical protein QG37_01413 [[Candida] auris]